MRVFARVHVYIEGSSRDNVMTLLPRRLIPSVQSQALLEGGSKTETKEIENPGHVSLALSRARSRT